MVNLVLRHMALNIPESLSGLGFSDLFLGDNMLFPGDKYEKLRV